MVVGLRPPSADARPTTRIGVACCRRPLCASLLTPHKRRRYKQEGLVQQLLGVAVAHERPDLEASRQDLLREMSENNAMLSRLEDTLLRQLSSATGEVLG